MEEELKTTEVPATVEHEKVQLFTLQILEDILPTIDEPEPILTILGTLSILFNRIKWKNLVSIINQDLKQQIKMEDKYFNETVLKQLIEVLNLPPEIVTNESDDDSLMSLINLSFIQLMNIYLEQHKCPAFPGSITMQLFDQTVAYEIDFLSLLRLGDDFHKNLNHIRQEKIEEKKEHQNKVS